MGGLEYQFIKSENSIYSAARRFSGDGGSCWPTAAIATNSDARFYGVTESRFQSQSRTSTESTINRKPQRSNAIALLRCRLWTARGS